MKVFISSVIRTMTPERDVVDKAIRRLGHDPVRSEELVAGPGSARETIYRLIAESDLMILLLGRDYGAIQQSDLSATHDEFNIALEAGCRVIAAIRQDDQPDARQRAFINQVQEWETGVVTQNFAKLDDLDSLVTQAIRNHEDQGSGSKMDSSEMNNRAARGLGDSFVGKVAPSRVNMGFAPGPRSPGLIDPAVMESQQLVRKVEQVAAEFQLSSCGTGTKVSVDNPSGALKLRMCDWCSLTLHPDCTLYVETELPKPEGFIPVLIEDDVRDTVKRCIGAFQSLAARLDVRRLLTHVSIPSPTAHTPT